MINQDAMARAQARWDKLAKPLNGLGELERLIIKLAGIQGTEDVLLDKRCVLVLCADNGVVKEGVSQVDSSVTEKVALAIAEGRGNINAMARAAGADVFPIDVGMLGDAKSENLILEKIAHGTDSILSGAAMTKAEAEQALALGETLVLQMKRRGYKIIATGEMGIGNTTTSSALASVLLGRSVPEVTGRGAGLSDKMLDRKIEVIKHAIKLNQPDGNDPLDVLHKLGGLDIAVMAGVFLGGQTHEMPIVIDGVISGVAALIAARMRPEAKQYMLASHVSREPAGQLLLEELGLNPILHANLSLGEGTGAVSLFPLLELALALYNQNTTLTSIEVPQYERFGEVQS